LLVVCLCKHVYSCQRDYNKQRCYWKKGYKKVTRYVTFYTFVHFYNLPYLKFRFYYNINLTKSQIYVRSWQIMPDNV
jgi:hypothetical protein